MSDDLVKRANFCLSDMQGRVDASKLAVFLDCIDRIEELEADLAYWQKDSADAWDKCEENRVKLAKAVEALERIEDASKYFGNCPEASETTVRYAHETTRRLARTTLADLTGGKDE